MTLTKLRPELCQRLDLPTRLGWEELLVELLRHFPSPNLFYAIRVEGRFEKVRTRAVRKQATER